ncbi:hypothetical protein Amsp01_002200 [Amycolatopsis sp. NBRC 101858]|nr:hypothetical protein Amsp01_002200 [Amycolatopsis sp. NBRC 101858]
MAVGRSAAHRSTTSSSNPMPLLRAAFTGNARSVIVLESILSDATMKAADDRWRNYGEIAAEAILRQGDRLRCATIRGRVDKPISVSLRIPLV